MRKYAKRNKAKFSKVFKSEREWLAKFNYKPTRLMYRKSKPFFFEGEFVPGFSFVLEY